MNLHIIIGNLGADPELRSTTTGKSVCNLSVATNNSWVGADGVQHKETTWHRVVVWGKQGEACAKFLSKGRQVSVQGPNKTREWKDRAGVTRYTAEIIATNVEFLGSPQAKQQTQVEGPPPINDEQYVAETTMVADDGDVPF